MRKYTDEQVLQFANDITDVFIDHYGKDLDEEQRKKLREEIFLIAMREEIETREAASKFPSGLLCNLALDDELHRVWHRAFRDKSAVAAKYGIDTGFEKISKNWDY